MSREARIVIVVAVLVFGLWVGRATPSPYGSAAAAGLSDSDRAGALRFAAEVAPADRVAIEAAIAAARPEARRLIEQVDGAVEVQVGPPAGGPVGLMETTGEGYRVTLDLARVSSENGQRGIARLVLHELGHVVDHALVTPDLAARLDASVSRGWVANGAASGSSASREERFAESFAKWATGDIGVDLYLGYAVPPPPVDWGAPLAAL